MPEKLRDVINNFAESISALREFVSLIGPVLDKTLQETSTQYSRHLIPFLIATLESSTNPVFTKEYIDKLRALFDGTIEIVNEPSDSDRCLIKVTGPDAKKFQEANKAVNRASAHKPLLYKSSLVSLASTAEWFLSQLIREKFQRYPDSAGIKDKALTLKELEGFGSVEDARRYLIDLRVDEIIRGSLEDWLDFLKTNLQLSMGYLSGTLDELVEVFQRRNVTVHNNGTVHSLYIKKVKDNLRQGVLLGANLPVDVNYLNKAIDLVERTFVLIGAELWKKWEPNDEDRAILLITVAFERLIGERWSVAESLSYFVKEDKQMPETHRLKGELNYWQAKKWQGAFELVRSEVEAADFSAKDRLFQISRLALLDKTEDFFAMLPSVLDSKHLDLDMLYSWPIFRSIRATETFKSLYGIRDDGKASKTDIATVQ
jgi:hypothetical protein